MLARVTNQHITPAGILADSKVPGPYALYPDDPWAFCIRRTVRDTESWFLREVVLDYSTDVGTDSVKPTTEAGRDLQAIGGGAEAGKPQNYESPLDEPPTLEWGTQLTSVPLEEDSRGNPITTSAGEYFDPPIEVDLPLMQIVITRNERQARLGFLNRFVGAVNSKTWLGLEAGTVKCTDINVSSQYRKGVFYAKVKYQFLVKAIERTTRNDEGQLVEWIDKWQPMRVIDQGFWYIDKTKVPGSIERGPFHNVDSKTGNPLSRPVPLDGNGARQDPAATPHFRTFYPFPERTFQELGLGG